ncbi:unnamed protein product [Linum trigynum]|uniref:Uncharacterized protein n=1 Tax=Linum trigynum TaxID=586398 RepID=A0AAV2FUL0_9ROSI
MQQLPYATNQQGDLGSKRKGFRIIFIMIAHHMIKHQVGVADDSVFLSTCHDPLIGRINGCQPIRTRQKYPSNIVMKDFEIIWDSAREYEKRIVTTRIMNVRPDNDQLIELSIWKFRFIHDYDTTNGNAEKLRKEIHIDGDKIIEDNSGEGWRICVVAWSHIRIEHANWFRIETEM